MKRFLPWLFTILLFGVVSKEALATHNRAGEIQLVQDSDDCSSLTLTAIVKTYTKASSGNADRDSVTICWGDGVCERIPRTNGNGTILPNDIKVNFYEGSHTYSGRGRYVVSITDPNRIANIININDGASVQIPFYIETVYTFLDPQFRGCNSTPTLLQPPIDVGCVGKEFRHNPNAFDPDGDSLAYQLTVPLQAEGVPVPNYRFPNQVNGGALNLMDLNEVTGDFIWSTPQRAGDYNLAILIIEYRNGIAIDTTIRDLQIQIEECENLPPDIETIREICVVAGETLEFEVKATPPSIESQKVNLSAFGAPFEIRDPAVFIVPSGFQPDSIIGTFRWETKCEHIAKNYYSVVFRSEDDFPVLITSSDNGRDTIHLSTLETVRIKVVGPPPEDLQAAVEPGAVNLSWLSPYTCEAARANYFLGFSVWRKLGSNNFPIDTCETGLDGKGYRRIAFRLNAVDNNRYVFKDEDVERGRTYCYRVLAHFARYTTSGQPYNLVESIPSDEVCVQLSRDIPLLTNADVLVTDGADGQVLVRWLKPKAEDLDTIQNPPPYRYQVLRADGIGGTNFSPIANANFIANSFASANDTTWIDSTGLNTSAQAYSYKVEFYVNGEAEPLGDTEEGSTIFLNIFATDEKNVLSWEFAVPWENSEYVIYRDDNGDSVFDSIGVTRDTIYEDEGLANGKEYCYYVESKGSYGIASITGMLLNKSQRSCATPIDNVPPCPPPLMVDNICNSDDSDLLDPIENRLTWQNPEDICDDTDDVVSYKIYYSPDSLGDYQLIAEIDDEEEVTYYHSTDLGLLGCYAVTAIDSVGNESAFSNVECRDNCPFYELPNAFTPNGDGQNEIFTAFPFRFIANVDMKIFNRWGNLVYETTDPNINWDGTNMSGDELTDGVYFYKCQVFEQRIEGVTAAALLSGYIELVREAR